MKNLYKLKNSLLLGMTGLAVFTMVIVICGTAIGEIQKGPATITMAVCLAWMLLFFEANKPRRTKRRRRYREKEREE